MPVLIQESLGFPEFGPSYICRRCRRGLSNPTSIQAGMGPVCRGHQGKGQSSKEDDMRKFHDFFIWDVPLSEKLVIGRERDGDSTWVKTNVPHLVIEHSPDGFEFGYPGSGPADLALNICEWYLRHIGYDGQIMECFNGTTCFSLAFALHQDFKDAFVVGIPRYSRYGHLGVGAEIPFSDIKAWFDVHLNAELLSLYEKKLIDEEVSG